MKKIKIIRKEELDFDIVKIQEIEKVDLFEDRIEIHFKVKDDKNTKK